MIPILGGDTCSRSPSLFSSLYPYLIKRVKLLRKFSFWSWFPNCFPSDFLKKMGWFFYSIHLSISYLFRFWLKTHFLLLFYSSFNYYLFRFWMKTHFLLDWTSRRSRGQAWWGLQECSKRWRHAAEVRRCWLSNPWKISKLELSKTFYALVTLDSGIFLSLVDS